MVKHNSVHVSVVIARDSNAWISRSMSNQICGWRSRWRDLLNLTLKALLTDQFNYAAS